MKLLRTMSISVVSSSLAFVLGCGSEPAPKTVTTTTSNAAPAPEPAPAPAAPPADTNALKGMGGEAPPGLPPVTPSAFSDEQIAAVSGAANRGEVEQAKLAVGKAKDAKVKKFATMLASHHGDANTAEVALLKKQHLTAEESTTSTQLTLESTRLVESLRPMTGTDFDKAYMDAQVKEHTAILDTMDTKLLPAVKNAELKAGLTAMRAKVETHLKDAQAIQTSLNAAPAAPQLTTTTTTKKK
jgi:putative membrane protein